MKLEKWRNNLLLMASLATTASIGCASSKIVPSGQTTSIMKTDSFIIRLLGSVVALCLILNTAVGGAKNPLTNGAG
ncbi:MAG: hypothetical protein Q8R24_03070 [Legionellaceae bacterium]|nr:hypothetical protein [Legionellaceae bacterium]